MQTLVWSPAWAWWSLCSCFYGLLGPSIAVATYLDALLPHAHQPQALQELAEHFRKACNQQSNSTRH